VLGRRAEAAAVFRRVAVEDEADGDGQVWIAFALAGLEQTLDDSVAFRAACREIAAARPAADPLSLVQWWLRPALPNLEFATCNAIFWQKLDVSEGWTWYDPYADCSYSVDDAGTVIYASHYFRDLWFNNASAPRLMQTVSGDFAVEAVCRIAFPDRPAMGGLVLWKNVNNFLRLGWGAHGPHTLDLMGCLDGRDLYLGRGRLPTEGEKGEMWLRLERVGSTVRGLCSVDGKEWFSVGQVHLRVDDPLEVGLFATGMIQRWAYPAAYPDGAAVRFQSFRLW
jgi:regulation of enolase protein 1 (concanavalin A-like superfamily)